MDVLLDTHAFLWFIHDDPQLSSPVRALIEDSSNDVFISIASCWEIAIKYKIGKLTFTELFSILLPREIQNNDFRYLTIEYKHAEYTVNLELHHKDSFDRLLIAQSLVENMPLISNETIFDHYSGLDRRW